jgi:hypothetical protein
MLKLYEKIDGVMNYWETWDNGDNSGTVHWGRLGQRGENKIVKSGYGEDFHDKIQNEINAKIEEGFRPADEDDLSILLIEYKVDGMGNQNDLEKRTRLQSRMDETLGWTGLGHCDGGSMGSGTMEVCCFVVDFDTAKEVIEKDLKDTEFSDYLRIFDESVG